MMKYLAVIDGDFLNNFRIEYGGATNPIVMVAKDKDGFQRGIVLKPIQKEIFVSTEGDSIYLCEEHINALLEMERKEMVKKALSDIKKRFRD